MSSHQMTKQTRLLRQASVLHEIQENQERDSLDGRYARLMTELSVLCSDRSNVITADSLAYFATTGRAEPVKLEREPERASDSLQKSRSGKQEDLLSADAARRQRVEELTRFFMEAKSDIDFALGAGREFREAKDKDKESESERDDDRENETGDDEEIDKSDDLSDPAKQLASMHARLLKEDVDNRVYNHMLSQIREQNPALYGAVLCHPLITGVDPKKDKKKKKKRKERERRDKTQHSSSTSAMLVPDFSADALLDEEMALNASRFVARAVADGSIQALMLAAKLVLSLIARGNTLAEPIDLMFPLVSYLRVLRGEKAPEFPPKASHGGANQTAKEATATPKHERGSQEASFSVGSVDELNLRDQSEQASPISIGDSAMAAASSDEDAKQEAPKPRPIAFSPEEILALGPFDLAEDAGFAATPVDFYADQLGVGGFE
uniref:Uncharacterized protein n=1 Tax=Globisporangium ultimum (strain ATCC 200006 / CBS 805.95 / DAOM BR144) TaxID=431595 RepID=K3X888_GLOUD